MLIIISGNWKPSIRPTSIRRKKWCNTFVFLFS